MQLEGVRTAIDVSWLCKKKNLWRVPYNFLEESHAAAGLELPQAQQQRTLFVLKEDAIKACSRSQVVVLVLPHQVPRA